ncbi:MAG: hypothetical protein M0Z79_08660 [Nitrospiraceae bacterium]|nr:hypothetical protein [Nitrospiraceae bacterium]
MTKLRVDPGQCGMSVVVEVDKKGKDVFELRITSDCEMVRKLGEAVPSLTLADAFKKFSDNPVYRKGAACLRHAACPVPGAILKALEVEAGLGVPRDVTIVFIRDEDE